MRVLSTASPTRLALLIGVALVPLAAPAQARRRLVPEQYSTVQNALNASVDGDTILVAPGRYYENLTFGGKAVVLASHFALNRDPNAVFDTILDGSRPVNWDQASVVTFRNGETRASVLEGFTITGGTGTRWKDEHSPGVYREGGGLMVIAASPTIRYNRIVDNRAIATCYRCVSAGGGGIRVGDGSPLIEHNVIAGNQGLYGAGLVSNYASVDVRNNLIVDNLGTELEGVQGFGGGGIWIYGKAATGTNVVAYNTLVGNRVVDSGPYSSEFRGRGGALLGQNCRLVLTGNVAWNNTQELGGPWSISADVEGSASYNVADPIPQLTGAGNVVADPRLSADFELSDGSPAIDAGHPSDSDPADLQNPGTAALPARGSRRADAGAYGGPSATRLPVRRVVSSSHNAPRPAAALKLSAWPQPATTALNVAVAGDARPVSASLSTLLGQPLREWMMDGDGTPVQLDLRDLAPGLYVLCVGEGARRTTRLLVID